MCLRCGSVGVLPRRVSDTGRNAYRGRMGGMTMHVNWRTSFGDMYDVSRLPAKDYRIPNRHNTER